jgi:hypothetical protein
MNCRRFQKLLFEYVEESLSARTNAAAESHLANCPSCRKIAQQHRQFARSLSARFHRAAEPASFSREEQDRLVTALQRERIVHDTQLVTSWWPRLAWIGASAAVLIIALFLMNRFPVRKRPSSGAGVASTPTVIQYSYCAPSYTFERRGDFVIDSLSCTPFLVQQTLWVERNKQPSSTKSGNASRL